MRHSRHKFIETVILSAAVLLFSGCPRPQVYEPPTRINVQGVYIHHQCGMRFPEIVADFERDSVINYSGSRRDNISVGYYCSLEYLPVIAMVYVYPAPSAHFAGSSTEIIQETRQTLFENHFNLLTSDITSQHRDTILLVEEEVSLQQPTLSLTGKKAVFNFKEIFGGPEQEIISELYLFQRGPWLIKYRISYPWAIQNQVRQVIGDFMEALTIPPGISKEKG